MPSLSRNLMAKWRNYHLTAQGRYVPMAPTDPDAAAYAQTPTLYPDGSIRETAQLYCADVAGMTGTEMFKATGALLGRFLDGLINPAPLPLPNRLPRDCVAVGRGWSFAPLGGARDVQIDMTGLAGMAMARFSELHPSCGVARDKVALVLGGTRLRDLCSWAQTEENLSIPTSGTHLGLTIAGAAATGSHGSRLGFGGVQNMVVGIHLVTGPHRSVWIERASCPVLCDTAIAEFSTEPPVRDDAVFADALVHLGSMGLVNGVALAMVEDSGYAFMAKTHAVDAAWLNHIEQGDFRQLAAALGRDEAPVFYELTLDPHGWDTNPALHTMYFKAKPGLPHQPVAAARQTLADLGDHLTAGMAQAVGNNVPTPPATDGGLPPLPPVFEMYKASYLASALVQESPQNARWNQLHGDEITGGYPGGLYNASFAIPRHKLAEAIPLICAAVADLPGTFLYTVRFVSKAAGTLAFTRFPHCAVIEIDGISRNAPLYGPMLGGFIEEGARRIRACLDGHNPRRLKIDYSMHWAKLGGLDAAKVAHDFGPASNPASPIGRWRATRRRLLAPEMLPLFWNKAVVDYGLVDAPGGGA